MWHASIAALDLRHGTLLVDEVNASTKRIMVRTAKKLLNDVGQLPTMVDQHQLAVHYRRAVTDEEWKALPQAWCDIPAVHQAGVGKVLEENT